jgi:hypothetical protein
MPKGPKRPKMSQILLKLELSLVEIIGTDVNRLVNRLDNKYNHETKFEKSYYISTWKQASKNAHVILFHLKESSEREEHVTLFLNSYYRAKIPETYSEMSESISSYSEALATLVNISNSLIATLSPSQGIFFIY